jgi:hypothetical protein
MRETRLGTAPYGLVWLALTALQFWLVIQAFPGSAPQDPAATPWWVLALAYAVPIQVIKAINAAFRLHDLGRHREEALLALVPLMNVGLWLSLRERTPSPELRERRLSALGELPSAFGSFRYGLGAMGSIFPIAWTLALVAGVAHTAAYYGLVRVLAGFEAMTLADRESTMSGLLVLGGALGLYTLIQLAKRATASRASWVPSLLLPSVLFAWGALYMLDGGGPIPTVLLLGAFDMFWTCVVGAFLAVAWITADDLRRKGEPVGFGPVIAAMRARGLDVAGPHGAAEIAIFVGLQVLVPGVLYMLQFAFVDQVALREPQEAALARSRSLSAGLRMRLFLVLLLGFLVVRAVQLPVALAAVGGAGLMPALMLQTALPSWLSLVWDITFVLGAGVVELALLHLYDARVASLAARMAQAG